MDGRTVTRRRFSGMALAGAAAALPAWAAAQERPVRVNDGRRTVEAPRYGVRLRAPLAWTPIEMQREERAVVWSLPQEKVTPAGFATVSLGVAPESLGEFQSRYAAAEATERAREKPRRRLLENELLTVNEPARREDGPPAERLVALWRHEADGDPWFELRTSFVRHDLLYTFALTTDEPHYDSYRLDLREVIEGAVLTAPEIGVQRLPNNYWLQREYRFGMQLPRGWTPAFAPTDRALLFATGATRGVFTENLHVLAGPRRELDWAALSRTLPAELQRADPACVVARSQVVRQAGAAALETLLHTRRGPLEATILERRFTLRDRTYEVRFTLETAWYAEQARALAEALESFREATSAPRAAA